MRENLLPKVSVYITNYNYERFIKESIESVLTQTLQDFELIIIDDGSTDQSKTIIEEYRNHPKIQIIYQQNKGLNVTNNIAMRIAKGKYLMRLDADDFLENTALEVMSSQLDNDTELGLVFPNYYYVDNNGERTGQEIRHDFSKEVSLYDLPAHGACTMIRLEFLKNLGGYNENFSCQDGYDLWIKFVSHFKVSNLAEPLFSYRRHGNNLTTNEERILNTRKQIKETFVNNFELETPTTVAILPFRNSYIDKENLPTFIANNKNLLELKIEELSKTSRINWIVVTSSEKEILESLKNTYQSVSKIIFLERPSELERQNISLTETFHYVLNHLESKNIFPEALMSVSLEFPFVKSDAFDDAVNTLTIFKADAVIAVRPDNRMFYQHIGHGMFPILDQDKFTKLEREALYRGVGGLIISKTENFKKNNKIFSGKVSHIVMDEKSSFGIFSAFDLEIFKKLMQ